MILETGTAGFTWLFGFSNSGTMFSAPKYFVCWSNSDGWYLRVFLYKDLDPKFGESNFRHFSARGALLHICAWYDLILHHLGGMAFVVESWWRTKTWVVSESHSAAAGKFLCLESDQFRSSLISNSVQNPIKDIVISWSWLTLPSMIEVEHDPKGSTSWVPKPSSTSMMGGRPGCNWNIFQPCRAGCLREPLRIRNRRGNC